MNESNNLYSISLSELLSWIDFDYSFDNGKFALIDLQGANLGDIESEQFDDIEQVIDRLDHYWEDTFLNGEICCDIDFDFETYEEAYEYCNSYGYVEQAKAIYVIMNPEVISLN